jgi:hypothetical protein
MQTKSFPYLFTLILVGLLFGFLAKCTDSKSNDEEILLGLVVLDQQRKAAIEAAKQCETEFDDSKTYAWNATDKTPLELCRPVAGPGRHFRIENIGTTSNNAYLNLLVGYPKDPENFPFVSGMGGPSPTTNLNDGRYRIFVGKSQSCNFSFLSPQFSGQNSGLTTVHQLFTTAALPTPNFFGSSCPGGAAIDSGIWGPSTICLDIPKGENGSSPTLRVWATGKNGADCANLKSLTKDNTIYTKSDFTSLVEVKDGTNYIYRNLDGIKATKIVVRSETAIQD